MPYTRQAGIIDLLLQYEIVRVKDLSDLYQVSQTTIRRDLIELEKVGMIKRYYGGAVLDKLYVERINQNFTVSNLGEHHQIIKEAINLIKPGSTIAITPSKIHETLCLMLPKNIDITIITNSLKIFDIIKNKFPRVFLAGGSYMRSTNSFEGEETKEAMSAHSIDLAFIGVNGIKNNTIFTGTMMEAIVKKSLIDKSKKTIILLENHKVNYKSNYALCSTELISYIIQDKKVQF